MRLAKYLATRGRRLAARLRADHPRRAGSRSTAPTVTDPAHDVSDANRGDGRWPLGFDRCPRAGRLRAQQAGRRRVDRPRPTGPSDRGDDGPADRAPVPGRSPGHRHHRPDPAHQPGRARPPADPSLVRGREDLPGGGGRATRPTSAELRALREGVELEEGRTAPARVRRISADTLEITIHEGRKRQVKRMCEVVGHPVRRLERVAFGPLELGDLPRGRWRRLTETEIEALIAANHRSPSAGSAVRR